MHLLKSLKFARFGADCSFLGKLGVHLLLLVGMALLSPRLVHLLKSLKFPPSYHPHWIRRLPSSKPRLGTKNPVQIKLASASLYSATMPNIAATGHQVTPTTATLWFPELLVTTATLYSYWSFPLLLVTPLLLRLVMPLLL